MEASVALATIVAVATQSIFRSAASVVIKDLYELLNKRIAEQYREIDLKTLEANFSTQRSINAFAEALSRHGVAENAEIVQISRKLAEKLQENSPAISVGGDVDIEQIKSSIEALSRQGDRFDDQGSSIIGGTIVSGSGNVVIGSSRAGIEPVEPWPPAGGSKSGKSGR